MESFIRLYLMLALGHNPKLEYGGNQIGLGVGVNLAGGKVEG